MRLLKGLLTLVILLSLSSFTLAEDNICFDQATAGKIVVELERSRIMAEAYKALEASDVELHTQLSAYKSMLDAEQEKAGVYESTIKSYDQALKDQRGLCNQALKDAKPSFFKQLLNNIGFIGVGILVGFLL